MITAFRDHLGAEDLEHEDEIARPVRRHMTSSVAMYADSPMVKIGKMMWKAMVKPNWRRDRKTVPRSIRSSKPPWPLS